SLQRRRSEQDRPRPEARRGEELGHHRAALGDEQAVPPAEERIAEGPVVGDPRGVGGGDVLDRAAVVHVWDRVAREPALDIERHARYHASLMTTDPTPDGVPVAQELEALFTLVERRYGSRLSAAELEGVRQVLQGIIEGARELRAV